MKIAQMGNFALCTATYLGEHTYMTHEINIVKYYEPNKCYVIAQFTNAGEISSIDTRLLDSIKNSDDLDNINTLAIIGRQIIQTENVPSGYQLNLEDE